MKKRILIGMIVFLFIVGAVIAQQLEQKEKEQKVKDYLSVDFKDAKNVKVKDIKSDRGIMILTTEVDGKLIKVITTDQRMDDKIKSKNPSAKPIKLEE